MLHLNHANCMLAAQSTSRFHRYCSFQGSLKPTSIHEITQNLHYFFELRYFFWEDGFAQTQQTLAFSGCAGTAGARRAVAVARSRANPGVCCVSPRRCDPRPHFAICRSAIKHPVSVGSGRQQTSNATGLLLWGGTQGNGLFAFWFYEPGALS